MPARARLVAIVATLAAPAVLYTVLWSAVAGLGASAALHSLALSPPNYALYLKIISRVALAPQVAVTPEITDLARKSAQFVPLAVEPLLVVGKNEERLGRLDRAIRLFEEARRRRPSSPVIRAQLAQYYGMSGSHEALLKELDMALRLSPELQPRLLPGLAQLVRNAEGRIALAPVLSSEPPWRGALYEMVIAQNIPPADVAAIVRLIKDRKRGRGIALERDLYIRSLMAAGDYPGARSLWFNSLSKGAQRPPLVFDSGFKGVNASSPFNWSLKDGDVGRAEISSSRDGDSYLEVRYFGGRSSVLAEQALALPAGRYRLSASVSGNGGQEQGQLSWRLTCVPGEQRLLELALKPLTSRYTRYEGSFTVPKTACRGQTLSLEGDPGDVSGDTTAQITELKVTGG